MHVSRIACLLLGAWIGGSIFMAAVAIQNFQSVDRTLEQEEPQSRQAVDRLGGEEPARAFLRYHVSEQNRFYFAAWDYAQLAIGLTLFLILLFGTHGRTWAIGVSLLMLAIAGVMSFSITPSVTALGRELDFVPAGQATLIRSQFRAWHSAYAALEVGKLSLGIILALMLIASNGARRR